MRKVALVFILGFSMLGCSVSDVTSFLPSLLPSTPTQAAPPTATVYVTPSQTPTITPTLPTPTFTITPTLSSSGSSFSTTTPIPTSTVWVFVPNNPVTSGYGFASYQMGGDLLYWGVCQPNVIHVTAKPSDIIRTHDVLLFLKLQDQKSPFSTDWGSGAIMDSDGKGTFTYKLTAKNLPGYQDYTLAWIQYQFVATDKRLNVIGRTSVITSGLAYAVCP